MTVEECGSPLLEEGKVHKLKSFGAKKTLRRGPVLASFAIAALALMSAAPWIARAEQPPPPCHPNPLAAQDEATVRNRGDIVNLPMPLKDRLAQLANRPHSQ